MNSWLAKRRKSHRTIGAVAEDLLGPDADALLLTEQEGEVQEEQNAEVVEPSEAEVKELLATFGLYWDEEKKGFVITGPPGTVERVVAMIALTYLLSQLMNHLF